MWSCDLVLLLSTAHGWMVRLRNVTYDNVT
jgi:hypothetical protein